MTWYYAVDGKQNGPFTPEQFGELIASGQVQSGTLVWQEKLPNWVPLAQVPPELLPQPSVASPGSQPPPAASLARCSNCGGQFSPDNLVQIESALVCPACKPIVLHRIKEGFDPLRTAVSPDELVHRIAAENRTFEVGHTISRAWAMIKSDMGPMIGATMLVFAVMMASGFVPFIGSCISLVITGPLMGGLYLYYLKRIRNEPALVGDAFSGFKLNFVQLMLASIVTSILAYLPLAPFGIYFFANTVGGGGQPDFGVVDVLLLVFGMVVMLYLFIAWMFTIPLVIDKGMGFWAAMSVSRRTVNQRLGVVILLMLATMGISILGVLACLVGLIFTIPLVFLAYAFAYESLFGDRPVATAMTPNA